LVDLHLYITSARPRHENRALLKSLLKAVRIQEKQERP